MKQVFSNNARTTVASTLSADGLSLTVSDASVFPSLGADEYFLATLFRVVAGIESGHEVVKVTGVTGNILTISDRSYEGAAASEFLAGAIVALRPTADSLQRLQIASNIIITPSGGLVATNVQNAIEELDAEKVAKVSSTDNAVTRFDGTTGDVQDSSVIIDDSGNVGIGTSSPETNSRLTVRHTDSNNMVAIGNSLEGLASGTNNGGAIYFGVNTSTSEDPTGGIEASWGDATTPQIHFGLTRGTSALNKPRYSAFFDGSLRMTTNGSERMRIDANGNFGIGTNSNAVNALRYFDIQNTDTGASAGAIARLITSDVAGTGVTTAALVKYKNGALYLENNETNSAAFTALTVGGTERMRIDSAGNVYIGSNTALHSGNASRKNFIINGVAPYVNQEGDKTGITSNAYIADLFKVDIRGGGVVDAAVNGEWMELTCTTADTTIAAGDAFALTYHFEGVDIQPLDIGTSNAKTVTISFEHAHSKTGTYCVALKNSSVDRAYIFEYPQSVANATEYHSETITLDTAGTWNTTTSDLGMYLIFAFMMGSTRQGTADSWINGNYHATSNQVNSLDTVGNKNRISNIQVEVGSVATEPEYVSYPDKLAQVQRYFEKVDVLATGYNTAGNPISGQLQYAVKKRTTPTASLVADGSIIANTNVGTLSSIVSDTNILAYRPVNSTGSAQFHEGYTIDARF